ncbi:hypothetical protein PVAND_005620 [Polypedilum vanderplanki]|uniref:Uncharacterized protein n=1 Tax=Polypedilum vanderplanki TaxID=319348 RepID=A0A9J6C2L6_POLVA|nr:hypothetical protein PVAND_005620 [Polypedilum vanderplanki]
METDIEKACRICGDEGIHNIFETDMKVDEKSIKVYIILNNFMYDKLYGPDEHSPFICDGCCDTLLSSYLFMIQVRESERILKTDGCLPPKKKPKVSNLTEKEEVIQPQNVELINSESLFEEDLIEEYEEEEDSQIQQQNNLDGTLPSNSPSQHSSTSSISSMIKSETKSTDLRPLLQVALQNEVDKKRKSQDKSLVTVSKVACKEVLPTCSILITDYKLVEKNNSDLNTVTILFLSRLMNVRPEEDYTFDEYYELIGNQDNNQIYSCSYCVKAFGTCELLIKHISSCHTCLLCFKVFHNGYNELGQHMKTHSTEKFQCPLCLKLFSQQLYRQHIKKNHFPNIPFFVSVRPNPNNTNKFISKFVHQLNKSEEHADKAFSRMTGYQIHSYGELDELQFSKNVKKPFIKSPNEMLVKVTASSVNPIDIAMIGGYGSTLLNTLRWNSNKIEFPLTLGRDFVGTVVQKGMEIDNAEYKLGDKVWGVVPVHKQGAHAEFVKIDKCNVSKKPSNINDCDAAAILYAGLTAYSGIFLSAQLNGLLSTTKQGQTAVGKKVLVLGGSGGVGHIAIQILLAEGADVITTCSQQAISLVNKLGVSKVVDYTTVESDEILLNESPYDFILDCAGKGAEYASVLPWSFGNYITFKSPLLKNFDDQGMLIGGLNNIKDLLTQNITVNRKGIVKWAYFYPSTNGILYLKDLVEKKKLLPVIDSKYAYNDLPKAYERVSREHLRGKVVIEYDK